MCRFPINIKNPNKASTISVDGLDPRRIFVPCGKCDQCYTKRQNHWYIRLHQELKESISAYFVTLTYEIAPRSFNDLATCKKIDLQNYFKRLRKREVANNSIKYYACSEYGELCQRPHYHIILFNVRDEKNIHRAWSIDDIPLGIVDADPDVNEANIKYVCGYLKKRQGIPVTDYDDRLPEFSLMSKNLGDRYLKFNAEFHKSSSTGYTVINEQKFSLPRYYKEKIWHDEIVITAQQQWVDAVRQAMLLHPKTFKSFVKHCIPTIDKFSDIKRPNFQKKLISKNNYENFIQSKNYDVGNFDSLDSWEKNKREVDLLNQQKVKRPIQTNGSISGFPTIKRK